MKRQTLWEGLKYITKRFLSLKEDMWKWAFKPHFILSLFTFLTWRLGTSQIRVGRSSSGPSTAKNSTYTHTPTPELALTSLNVNIYYLCTDHDTSDAPCWLHVCLECVCVWKWIQVCLHWLVLNVNFFVRGCGWVKKQKKVGQEPMALHLCSNWPRREKTKTLRKNGSKQKKSKRV